MSQRPNPLDLRPPSMAMVAPIYAVGALALLAILALVFLRVERVVVGHGVLVPTESSVLVTALRTGVVAEIMVTEGHEVAAGDVLLRFDNADDKAAVVALAAQVDAAAAEVEQRFLILEQRRELNEFRAQTVRHKAAEAAVGLDAARIEAEGSARDLQRSTEREERVGALAEGGVISRAEMEELEAAAEDAREEQVRLDALLHEKRMAIGRLSREGAGADLEAQVVALQDEVALLEAQASLASLQRLLSDAERRLARATIVAPTDGVVHALGVRSAGALVKDGATICRLVPDEGGLIAEVEVASADVGFLAVDRPARVKIDAFPFADYGVMRGTVSYVAPDASPAEQGTRRRLPVFTVRVTPKGGSFEDTAQRPVILRPGLTLTAEIVSHKEPLGAAIFRPLKGAWREVDVGG